MQAYYNPYRSNKISPLCDGSFLIDTADLLLKSCTCRGPGPTFGDGEVRVRFAVRVGSGALDRLLTYFSTERLSSLMCHRHLTVRVCSINSKALLSNLSGCHGSARTSDSSLMMYSWFRMVQEGTLEHPSPETHGHPSELKGTRKDMVASF